MALSISKNIHLQTTFESILANLNKVFEMGFAFKIKATQKNRFLLTKFKPKNLCIIQSNSVITFVITVNIYVAK